MKRLGWIIACCAACGSSEEACYEPVLATPSEIEVEEGGLFEVAVSTKVSENFVVRARGDSRETGIRSGDAVRINMSVRSFSTVERIPEVVAAMGIGRVTFLDASGPSLVEISENGFAFTTAEPGSFEHVLTFACDNATSRIRVFPPWDLCGGLAPEALIEVRCLASTADGDASLADGNDAGWPPPVQGDDAGP